MSMIEMEDIQTDAEPKDYRDYVWQAARGSSEVPPVHVLDAAFADESLFWRDVSVAQQRLQAFADLEQADRIDEELRRIPRYRRPTLADRVDSFETLSQLWSALQLATNPGMTCEAERFDIERRAEPERLRNAANQTLWRTAGKRIENEEAGVSRAIAAAQQAIEQRRKELDLNHSRRDLLRERAASKDPDVRREYQGRLTALLSRLNNPQFQRNTQDEISRLEEEIQQHNRRLREIQSRRMELETMDLGGR